MSTAPTHPDPADAPPTTAVTTKDGRQRTRAGSNYGDEAPSSHRPAPLDPDPDGPSPQPSPTPAPFDPAPLDPDPWSPGLPPTEAGGTDLGVDADDPEAPRLRALRDEAEGRRIGESQRRAGGVGPPRHPPDVTDTD